MTCKWYDEDLWYVITCTALTEADARQALSDVIFDQRRKFNTAHSIPPTNFTFPMSQQFLRDKFGDGAFQLSSGQSVVVVNPVDGCVYKCPLASAAALNLSKAKNALTGLTRTAIPVDLVGRYFKYTMYKPPLSPDEAKAVVVPFVKSIVAAIKELHDHNFAHLDIRLENVCIDHSDAAILIDIDRSEPVNREASRLFVRYSRSTMYQSSSSSWTCGHLDWKQLGLMIEDFMPVEPRHGFLRKLIDLGKFFSSEVKCVLVCPIFVGEYSRTDHDEWNMEISG